MKIEQVSLEKLIPYVNNARTHSEGQVDQIAASIREFGFTNPVLIDANNTIIAGHGRVLASKKLEMTEVPCIRLDYLSDVQRKAYILADNKIALNAGWNDDLLKLEFTELKDVFDLTLTGFNLFEINTIFDEKNDIQAEWDNMPEYDNDDKTAFRSVIVHFENNDDAAEFFSLIGQGHTDKTKSIWYPEQENMDTESKRY